MEERQLPEARRLSRRDFLALSAGLAVGAVAAACAPAAPAAPPTSVPAEKEAPVEKKAAPAEKVTIDFWHWWNLESGNSGDLHKWGLEEFTTRYPNITVERQQVPWGEYFRKLVAATTAGNAPDCLASSVDWGRELYDKGVLLDLMPYMEASDDVRPEHFFDPALYMLGKGPVQYGLPTMAIDHDCLFLNLDHFAEVGLTSDTEALRKEFAADWDWNTFTEAAVKLTKREGDEITRSGFLVHPPSIEEVSAWAACHGGHEESCFYNPGEKGVAFNDDDAAVHGFNWQLELFYDQQVSQPMSPERQDFNLFLRGEASMVIGGPWSFGNAEDNAPDMTWTAVFFPKAPYPGGQYSTDMWCNGDVITKDSKNPEAAWEYVHFHGGIDFQIKRIQTGRWASPRRDFYDTEAWRTALEQLPVLEQYAIVGEVSLPGPFLKMEALSSVVEPTAEEIMLREREVEDAVAEMVTDCDEILAEAGYA
jgi:ABC-type glycerol-3-phosphate transport system substrate-binding protein